MVGGTAAAAELKVLEWLAYIIEALAEDCPGEARRETAALAAAIEDMEFDPTTRAELLRGLREAFAEFERDSTKSAAIALARVNRFLWARFLPGAVEHGNAPTVPSSDPRVLRITIGPSEELLEALRKGRKIVRPN